MSFGASAFAGAIESVENLLSGFTADADEYFLWCSELHLIG